jgi:general L-amino acid transport system permease protein
VGQTHPKTTKPPFWRDVRTLAWLFQIAILGAVVAVVAILVNNVRVNSANLGIPVGFDFLDQPAGFPIPANDFRTTQSVRVALVEGALNTLRVAVLGIVLATLLGVALGVGRLSGNWLIRNLTRLYVEIIRNIPLLGILIFIYLAVVLSSVLPRVEDSWTVGSLVVANGRGLSVPWVTGSTWLLTGVVFAALLLSALVRRWRISVAEAQGGPANVVGWVLPVFVGVTVLGALAVGIGLSGPSLEGRQTVGGMTLQPEYFALLAALVLYTASHIAEIVRGSIQAVPLGQVEAAKAMALGGWHRMRYIVLPQAMRIALPSLGNQYLNLLKNSSLGFVVSYFELTKVTTTAIGNRAPAVPAYIVLMIAYLVASLFLSGIVNVFNRRLVIER